LLYGGLLAPLVFVAGFLVEGATRAGYSPWRHAVSQLSPGPGWPVNVVLLLLGGGGLLGLAGAWTDAPAGPTQRITMITGIGWCALLAGRLLETTPRRRLDHAPTAGQA